MAATHGSSGARGGRGAEPFGGEARPASELVLEGADARLFASLKALRSSIAREEKVGLFMWLAPTDLPNYWKIELSVGDAAEALSDEEISGYFRRVVGQ